ncbi:diacylglycerol kinase family protein [Neobacillus niacini]|jgi:undecaprenol kinase|uniref:diacylglycerol kinase family protein n=1 Tax=Neobacillus niacini TaxID=86668 RepID=UPI001C8E40CC|nr:diacylglycerol kinase family protein [Neobacillus niacini]MBY0145719.1 diacylglycerol kinase family protein [Neobacillus niacini]
MDLQDKRIRLWKSFAFAITGIKTALWSERNMRIHFVVSVLVILCAVFFSISKIEWLFILIAIGGIFSLELINTAIERVVDLITVEYHPLAKQAKDVAAGAVFIYAIMAVIIGILVFLPHVLNLLNRWI